ncbi:hypothetical protein CC1G_00603 [Coprinopsis cinerea okayama7|uniref:Uncharacterized protein n=1 Tax=Coprinopsis cinerea (strain Okayama-7 / 130 / ATCC MYA-4618 / FGSC 9003) TaxID=240176 RepID=A8N3T2_COPC7|nr:hypothetical protein CC1G_00603 [Coprinopsis cinerea okayama7\|eukprot:XP_001829424.2 hypothetical protein CC1G_00603 [Coprinopsis cinerea okayama7\
MSPNPVSDPINSHNLAEVRRELNRVPTDAEIVHVVKHWAACYFEPDPESGRFWIRSSVTGLRADPPRSVDRESMLALYQQTLCKYRQACEEFRVHGNESIRTLLEGDSSVDDTLEKGAFIRADILVPMRCVVEDDCCGRIHILSNVNRLREVLWSFGMKWQALV